MINTFYPFLVAAQYNPSKNLASKKFDQLRLPKSVHTV